jgi:hypothetical protein
MIKHKGSSYAIGIFSAKKAAEPDQVNPQNPSLLVFGLPPKRGF